MHNNGAFIGVDFPSHVQTWMALRTAARWEKKIAQSLAQAEIPIFLPTLTKKTKYKSKTQTAELPMFGGYLFCSEIDFSQSSRIPQTARRQISQILKPKDPAQLLFELQSIAKLLRDHQLIQEKQFGSPNETVRIIGGSMDGYEGKIIRLKPNKHVLIVEVSFLGTRLEVEIDEHLLEKKLPETDGQTS